MTRRIRWIVVIAVAFVLVAWPAAMARNLGSDAIGNIAPRSQLAPGSLVDRYPLSAYALDYHVDVGVTDLDGVAPTIAQWAAAQLWSLTSLLVKVVIDLFCWAFSLDLLNGGPGGGGGALAPVADAIASVYAHVIGQAWLIVALLAAGLWGIWKALVQRRYTETAAALGLSVAFVLVAMFFVYEPQQTVGQASRATNTLSLAFLAGANRGSLDDPTQAKRQVAEHLFSTLVYDPWVVLEFGGLRHCVDTRHVDDHGFPTPVSPQDPHRTVCRDHVRAGADGHGGYAPRFLRQPAGSDQRDAEYDALRKGEVPFLVGARQFAGYKVDKADAPAVDIQQQGGAFQRLTLSVIVFAGSLGAIALLGFLSLAVILAQVVALVLLGFAPVVLVIGVFPGGGHDLFRAWLGKLATAVFVKALYSLVIAIVVAVSAALAAATGPLGFLFAFALQSVFYWAIFLYRKQITARLVAATTGGPHHDHLPRARVVRRGADIATSPVSALIGTMRSGSNRRARQQSALNRTPEEHAGERRDEQTRDVWPAPAASANGTGLRMAPARDRSATSTTLPRTARRVAPASAQESSPRLVHEEVLRRARELRRRLPRTRNPPRDSNGRGGEPR